MKKAQSILFEIIAKGRYKHLPKTLLCYWTLHNLSLGFELKFDRVVIYVSVEKKLYTMSLHRDLVPLTLGIMGYNFERGRHCHTFLPKVCDILFVCIGTIVKRGFKHF